MHCFIAPFCYCSRVVNCLNCLIASLPHCLIASLAVRQSKSRKEQRHGARAETCGSRSQLLAGCTRRNSTFSRQPFRHQRQRNGSRAHEVRPIGRLQIGHQTIANYPITPLPNHPSSDCPLPDCPSSDCPLSDYRSSDCPLPDCPSSDCLIADVFAIADSLIVDCRLLRLLSPRR